MNKALDYQLESACKDRLAELHLGFPTNIFAVLFLDVRDHHVVLTLCFKLVSFFTFIFAVLWWWIREAAAFATTVPLFRQTYLGITIT